MKEGFTHKGYWWLPGKHEDKIAGVLTYNPNSSIELELFGLLYPNVNPIDSLAEAKNQDVIYGITSDAKEITLLRCRLSGSYNFASEFPLINYNCQNLLVGIHLESEKQKVFLKAKVYIPELSKWCPATLLDKKVEWDESGKWKSVTIVTENKAEILNETEINEYTTLILKGITNNSGNQNYREISKVTYLEILKREDSSIQDFRNLIFSFEQFLSFVALREVQCSEIHLYASSDGKRTDEKIQLFYIQERAIESKLADSSHYLFSFETVKDYLSDIIKQWYSTDSAIIPIRRHLIDSIKSKEYFGSNDFLMVAQAIDGFWLRFRDEEYKNTNGINQKKRTSYKTKIKQLLSEFNNISLIVNITDEIDIDSVVESRDYYSHFMNKDKKTKAADGIELYKMTHRLRILLICMFLNWMGFNNEQIDTIISKSNSTKLKTVSNLIEQRGN